MKKTNLILIALILFISPLLTNALDPGAVTPETIATGAVVDNVSSPIQDAPTLVNKIASIVGYIYVLFFIVAVAFILFAAFDYLSAGDDPEKAKTAHKKLTYAAIAIAIALLAVSFQLIIQNFIQNPSAGGGGGGGGGSGNGYSSGGGGGFRWQPFKGKL